MTTRIQSIFPAALAGARRAAEGPPIAAEDERPNSLTTIAATLLAVVVVGVIAVLLGMS
jgi:hypothetical protein